MRLAEVARARRVLIVATLAVAATVAAGTTTTAARPMPIVLDVPPEVPAVAVHDSVGDPACVSDVTMTLANDAR